MTGSRKSNLVILCPNSFRKQGCKTAVTSLLLGSAHFRQAVGHSAQSSHFGGSSLESGCEQLVARILYPSVQNSQKRYFSHTQVKLRRTTDKPIKGFSLPIPIQCPHGPCRVTSLAKMPRRRKNALKNAGTVASRLYSS